MEIKPDRPTKQEDLKSDDLIPARIINEFVYCPRLAYLEWIQGEWEDSIDTIEGRFLHRRVDVAGPLLPDPEDLEEGDSKPVIHARSIPLSAPEYGIIGRIDLVEAEGRLATPVDYKHGKKPPDGVWQPDLVQLGAQAILLKANGYQCEKGIIYYIGSKERVEVEITDEICKWVMEVVKAIRHMEEERKIPEPLEDSPKCPRCSLAGICLPDETKFLDVVYDQGMPNLTVMDGGKARGDRKGLSPDNIRRLYPILPDAIPVYVQEQGGYIGKQGECLLIKVGGKQPIEVPMIEISQLSIFGNVQVTTQTIHELCMRGIPICYFSIGGYFYGVTQGFGSRNVELRRAQFRKADDPSFCLYLAKRIVSAKIKNQRTMLRRNAEGISGRVLDQLEELIEKVDKAENIGSILGFEGCAARTYFENFYKMVKPKNPGDRFAFNIDERNRRPPRDPVNAMLSLCYSLLAKDLGVALLSVGFDPHLGFYHTTHHRRQSLALDLMEEFRPIIGDSVVISAINNGEIKADDFIRAARAVSLKSDARRRLIEAYERRLNCLITHPVFGYKISYRKLLEVQARLLGRLLLEEITMYPEICPR